MQPIYFIASYPRSGNTWVRAVIYELLRRQGVYVGLPGDLRPIDTFIPSDIRPALYARITGREPRAITPEMAAAARPDVHRLMAERATAPLYVKTHAAYGLFGRHPTINIKVTRGAVYLVRNPVSVAKSLANFLSIDLAEVVHVMQVDSAAQPSSNDTIWDPWSSWATNVRSWMGAGNFPVLAVRYEDLRADPVQWFAKIAAHAGISAGAGEIKAVTDELTLEKMASMVETGALKFPMEKRKGTFVGSQLQPGSPAEDEILAPLRTYAVELQRRLGYA